MSRAPLLVTLVRRVHGGCDIAGRDVQLVGCHKSLCGWLSSILPLASWTLPVPGMWEHTPGCRWHLLLCLWGPTPRHAQPHGAGRGALPRRQARVGAACLLWDGNRAMVSGPVCCRVQVGSNRGMDRRLWLTCPGWPLLLGHLPTCLACRDWKGDIYGDGLAEKTGGWNLQTPSHTQKRNPYIYYARSMLLAPGGTTTHCT